jgi:hypothetical protein
MMRALRDAAADPHALATLAASTPLTIALSQEAPEGEVDANAFETPEPYDDRPGEERAVDENADGENGDLYSVTQPFTI